LPIQVEPADVSLPTPSTASSQAPNQSMQSPLPPLFHIPALGPSCYDTLPIVNCPILPGMQGILNSLQREHISEQGRERPHHSTSTSDIHNLHHALADMFGLPPLLIPKPASDRSPSPMAAISQSQLCCDKSHQSPLKSTVPAT
jgi:hypothetical protein